MVFTVLSAVAELERSLIVERVKAGAAIPAWESQPRKLEQAAPGEGST
jgi:hypothetical protein